MTFLEFLAALFRRLFARRVDTEQSAPAPEVRPTADSLEEPSQEGTPASSMVEEGPAGISSEENPPATGAEAVPIEDQVVTPVNVRVLAVIFNPTVAQEGGQPLVTLMGWNDPVTLLHNLADDLREVSRGYANYTLVDQAVVDLFPPKKDGFQYDATSFITCCRTGLGFHQPDDANYPFLLNKFRILEKVQNESIDEVWIIAPPYSGLFESTMGGANAFFCNAPVLPAAQDCPRRFVVMGFNYERGLGEMLEAYGHRAENILQQVYRNRSGDANLWERFTRVERTHPGGAEVGTIHYAPNSRNAYEWGSHEPVLCGADRWLRYPNLAGQPTTMDCREWGGGDNRAHKFWWLNHLPHSGGQTGGIANNWWKYIVDVNKVK